MDKNGPQRAQESRFGWRILRLMSIISRTFNSRGKGQPCSQGRSLQCSGNIFLERLDRVGGGKFFLDPPDQQVSTHIAVLSHLGFQ